ncbi:hypothetical protein Pelo_17136 [Pelomyxa schiedti]|nr:hypothetical protein Pelo_17136 [Pelomyxa schiedti]
MRRNRDFDDGAVAINCGTRARAPPPPSHNDVQSPAPSPSQQSSSESDLAVSPAATPPTGCYVGVLPLWVLVELIGKRWVMWPERRVLVEFGAKPTDYREGYPEHYFMFFSVGPTLGLVHKPVVVSMEESCVGWIGGNTVITQKEWLKKFSVCEVKEDSVIPGESTPKIKLKGAKGCCNQRWVVIAGARKSTNESGLFVCKVENTQLDSCWNLMQYPWFDSVLSLSFFGSSEFDFESDVLEVIFTEERSTNEFLCVVHINLNKFVADVEHSLTVPLKVIGECNVSEKGIKAESLTQPLVDRSSGMYYFPLGNRACELKVLVLNTGQVITLIEGSPSARKLVVEAVAETYLSITKGGHNTVKTSVYSLPELISSATSLPPSPSSEVSCFEKVIPIHVHHFSPGSVVGAVGCGIEISSSLSMSSWHHSLDPKRPRLSKTRNTPLSERYYVPEVLMSLEFIDATTGTALFQVKQTNEQVTLLPVDIHPVPFHTPLGSE